MKININIILFKRKINLNKEVFFGEDFQKLWDKIKYKTTCSVNVLAETLIEKCCESIKNEAMENTLYGKVCEF